MDLMRLVAEVDSPTLHRKLLGDFCGPYSLGVGRDEASARPVLLLMVPPGVAKTFPSTVLVAGEPVQVVVQRDFQPPVPFGARQGCS